MIGKKGKISANRIGLLLILFFALTLNSNIKVSKSSQIESTREALPMEFGGGATAYDESNTDISVDAR